jgi:hypothetical protein
MNRVIAVIWSAMLIVTGLGVVPVVLVLLRRALRAARSIEQYTTEMLAGGIGIANNTSHVVALKDTISVASQLLGGAESLSRHTATIESAFTGTDQNESQAQDKEVER